GPSCRQGPRARRSCGRPLDAPQAAGSGCSRPAVQCSRRVPSMRFSRFTVRRTFAVPHSGDTRRSPSRRESDRARPPATRPRARDSIVTLVALAAGLALIPLVLATLVFGHAFRASETGRADAKLAAAARVALDSIAATNAAAAAAART